MPRPGTRAGTRAGKRGRDGDDESMRGEPPDKRRTGEQPNPSQLPYLGDVEDCSRFTVLELRQLCKFEGLDASGSKAVLVERVQGALGRFPSFENVPDDLEEFGGLSLLKQCQLRGLDIEGSEEDRRNALLTKLRADGLQTRPNSGRRKEAVRGETPLPDGSWAHRFTRLRELMDMSKDQLKAELEKWGQRVPVTAQKNELIDEILRLEGGNILQADNEVEVVGEERTQAQNGDQFRSQYQVGVGNNPANPFGSMPPDSNTRENGYFGWQPNSVNADGGSGTPAAGVHPMEEMQRSIVDAMKSVIAMSSQQGSATDAAGAYEAKLKKTPTHEVKLNERDLVKFAQGVARALDCVKGDGSFTGLVTTSIVEGKRDKIVEKLERSRPEHEFEKAIHEYMDLVSEILVRAGKEEGHIKERNQQLLDFGTTFRGMVRDQTQISLHTNDPTGTYRLAIGMVIKMSFGLTNSAQNVKALKALSKHDTCTIGHSGPSGGQMPQQMWMPRTPAFERQGLPYEPPGRVSFPGIPPPPASNMGQGRVAGKHCPGASDIIGQLGRVKHLDCRHCKGPHEIYECPAKIYQETGKKVPGFDERGTKLVNDPRYWTNNGTHITQIAAREWVALQNAGYFTLPPSTKAGAVMPDFRTI